MSRLFDQATGTYLQVDSSPVTTTPLTMHCWFNITGAVIFNTVFSIQQSNADNWWRLRARSGFGLNFLCRTTAVAENAAVSSNTITANVWNSACGVATSSTSRDVYLNGTGKGSQTISQTPTGINRVSVGMVRALFTGEGTTGLIAHPAIWNVALAEPEIAMLAAGLSPLLVRPASLVFYSPYIGRDSPEIEIIGSRNLTVSGATSSPSEPIVNWPSNPI
jgi:hypothetical protein